MTAYQVRNTTQAAIPAETPLLNVTGFDEGAETWLVQPADQATQRPAHLVTPAGLLPGGSGMAYDEALTQPLHNTTMLGAPEGAVYLGANGAFVPISAAGAFAQRVGTIDAPSSRGAVAVSLHPDLSAFRPLARLGLLGRQRRESPVPAKDEVKE